MTSSPAMLPMPFSVASGIPAGGGTPPSASVGIAHPADKTSSEATLLPELSGVEPTENATVLLADLLESFDGGGELCASLQGALAQLHEVATASARSPLLDPSADQLGTAPRAAVGDLLGHGPSESTLLMSAGEEVPAHVSSLGMAPLVEAAVVSTESAIFSDLPHVSAGPVAEPLATRPLVLPSPERGGLSTDAGSPGAAPFGSAAAVSVGPSLPSVVPSSGPLPTPEGGKAPPPVVVQASSFVSESVTVLSRSVRATVASQLAPSSPPTTAGASVSGGGTFDGTPWLLTGEGRQGPDSLRGSLAESDTSEPSLSRSLRSSARPVARSLATGKATRSARPLLNQAMTLALSADAQSGAADPSLGQATDVTRPAMSSARPSALPAQLSQAALSSAPEAPVMTSERPLSRVDLRVVDGDRVLRLGVAREAEGYAVEVRAPRDVVAEIRDLEADVDAALREDGEDGLASFDATAEDEAFDGSDLLEAEAVAEVDSPADASPAVDPHRLLDRRA